MNEKHETFENIFEILKKNYQFNPKNFIAEFGTSQIKAIQKCFPQCNVHCYFFHFSKAIWCNFKKCGLSGKGTYSNNHEL